MRNIGRNNLTHEGRATLPGPGNIRAQASDSTDVQGAYNVIKDTVQKVKLPQDYKLNDNRFAVSKQDNATYNLINRCARYTETSLKLLQELAPSIEEGSGIEDSLDKVLTVQIAQQRYLQEQYAALVVQKDFGNHTARVFKSLQSNTSAFPQASLENLRAAVQLTSITPPTTGTSSRGNWNQWRGRSRGRGYQSGYRGRGDTFHQMMRDVPPSRPDGDNSQ